MNKYTYYKPKKLAIGIIIIVFSCIGLGYLCGLNQSNVYLFVLGFIGLIIGEGFILDASSYKTPKSRGKNNG